MSVDDVWVTWTLNGWNVACEARALPFYYKTQEAAIRFGTILAKLRRCDLFVEGEYHPARSSGDSRRNLERPSAQAEHGAVRGVDRANQHGTRLAPVDLVGNVPQDREEKPMIDTYTREFGRRESATAQALSPRRNHLLAALPAEVQAHLFPRLAPMSLPVGEILSSCGDVQRDVYFPIDSIVALCCTNENGSSTEVSVVGNEGLVGLPSLMGGQSSPWGAVVQCAGVAYRLPSDALRTEVARNSEVLSLMLRYTQALIAQISQTAVCNRHHSIDQQVCRCLLRCLDRLPTAEIAITQEVMASMLGVRREGITMAAGKLRRLGLINYRRGRIEVANRRALEDLTCECYAMVKAESDRLLPCLSRGLVA